jgi:hypothetical protein
MQIKLHVNSKIKIWVQGHKEPIWVKVLELNGKGFPIKVEIDNRVGNDYPKILNRNRMDWMIMVHDGMCT